MEICVVVPPLEFDQRWVNGVVSFGWWFNVQVCNRVVEHDKACEIERVLRLVGATSFLQYLLYSSTRTR